MVGPPVRWPVLAPLAAYNSTTVYICLFVSQLFYKCALPVLFVLSSICLYVCVSVGFCKLLCPLLCIWCRRQSCRVVCLQSLDNKGMLHPLHTLLNNEPIPQVLKHVEKQSCFKCKPKSMKITYLLQISIIKSNLQL